MSRNGELALRRVVVTYSPIGGVAGSGLRQALAREIPAFAKLYPTVAIEIHPRRWPEPYLAGVYRDGSERTFNVKNLSAQGVWIRLHRLVNEANDYDVPFNAQTMHFSARSVQGSWNPWLWTYERHESRTPQPRWDRPKLSEDEWNYYVDQYSARMRHEATEMRKVTDHGRDVHFENTKEVAERFAANVAPRMNSDMTHNLGVLKDRSAKDMPAPAEASMSELRLFASPDHYELGGDIVRALRKAELAKVDRWWAKRKESAKPPK